MIAPLIVTNDEWFRGTVDDNIFLGCCTPSDKIFALAVVVRAGSHRFCVFTPTDQAIDTYISFLNEPPQSVRVRPIRFRPAKGGEGAAWESDPKDMQLPLRQSMSEVATS